MGLPPTISSNFRASMALAIPGGTTLTCLVSSSISVQQWRSASWPLHTPVIPLSVFFSLKSCNVKSSPGRSLGRMANIVISYSSSGNFLRISSTVSAMTADSTDCFELFLCSRSAAAWYGSFEAERCEATEFFEGRLEPLSDVATLGGGEGLGGGFMASSLLVFSHISADVSVSSLNKHTVIGKIPGGEVLSMSSQ